MWIAEWIVRIAVAYMLVGGVFAIVFCAVGVTRMDRSAANSGAGFRCMIFPGVSALWPLMLKRWMGVSHT